MTTEVIRHGLVSAASQMKRALVRTAFSPVIYEVLDFAVALYDDRVRLLAQAPSLPMFMGRLSFCVEAAVAAVGARSGLAAGDVLLYNDPYGTGSHPQDAAMVAPVFAEGELIGYAAVKAHWLDIGGKDPYSTDTVDVFQEGTIFPGVHLYEAASGWTTCTGWRSPIRACPTWWPATSTPRSSPFGPATGRSWRSSNVTDCMCSVPASSACSTTARRSYAPYFERMPDGVYRAEGLLDDDGVSTDPVPFAIALRVEGLRRDHRLLGRRRRSGPAR